MSARKGTRVSLPRIIAGVTITLVLIVTLAGSIVSPSRLFKDLFLTLIGARATVQERIEAHQASFDARLRPRFEELDVNPYLAKITLVYFKDTQKLYLLASEPSQNGGRKTKLVTSWPVLAKSGNFGPKRRAGDRQIPEGIYGIESLNPNSAFHLSLRVNYPNEFDRARAAEDGRTDLGSDIMIHGDRVSIGCIAIGNDAIEELFVLAALNSYRDWKLISAPTDLRHHPAPHVMDAPIWLSTLYDQLRSELEGLGIQSF